MVSIKIGAVIMFFYPSLQNFLYNADSIGTKYSTTGKLAINKYGIQITIK